MLAEAMRQFHASDNIAGSLGTRLGQESQEFAQVLIWELIDGAQRRRPFVNSWSSLTGFLVWIDSAAASRIRKICEHLSGESRQVALWEIKRVAAGYKIEAIVEHLEPERVGSGTQGLMEERGIHRSQRKQVEQPIPDGNQPAQRLRSCN